MLAPLGRTLLVAGLALAAVGLALLLADRVPFLGRLPGDFTFRRGGVTIFMPLATSILISIVVTIVLNLLLRK